MDDLCSKRYRNCIVLGITKAYVFEIIWIRMYVVLGIIYR